MKKKIIIFGATGNTGSYLTLYAKKFFNPEEFDITASGRRETDVFSKYGIDYVSCDVTKEKDFERLPQENVYAVMLLAAQIPSYMDKYSGKKYIDSIIVGGFNVLEYCRKVKADRIIFTQTVFDISGYPQGTLLKPDLPPKFSYTGDHAVYVISKNSVIELMKHYHAEYGLKNFVFRLPTIYNYSPYQYYFPNGKKTMRPIYQMINKAISGEPIELWGNPNYSKDMVHVYDFSQELCKAVLADVDGGIYNVGTGIPVTLEEQIRTIIEVFSPADKKSRIIYKPEKKSGGGFLMDISNAMKDLGYEPVYTCRKLFENFRDEMKINRFAELRMLDK